MRIASILDVFTIYEDIANFNMKSQSKFKPDPRLKFMCQLCEAFQYDY